ncbi:hypothetical protein QJQ45_012834 [Haematococcus lacustris]|nr:hypothetical protein QJQ45_012834 [Haematococcus lacustris]
MTKISSRLLYRSKQRGFLELDLLVGLWAEKEIPAMNLPMLQDLAVMLDQENPDLFKWLTGQLPPSELMASNMAFKALRKHVAQQLGSNSQQKSHASQGVEWVRGWDDAWRLHLETGVSRRALSKCRQFFVSEQCVLPNPHRPGKTSTVGREFYIVSTYMRRKTLGTTPELAESAGAPPQQQQQLAAASTSRKRGAPAANKSRAAKQGATHNSVAKRASAARLASSRSAQGKQRQDRRDGWTTRRRQVIKVPEGAVLRGCKKTRRKLREHLRLRAEIHSQLRFIASLFVLRIFLTCLVGYPTPGSPSAPQPPAVQPPQPPDAPPLPPLPQRAPAQPAQPAQPASMECDNDSDSEPDCGSEPEPQSDSESESESEPEPVAQPPQRRCSARLAALAPAAPAGPPLPLDCEDPLMLRQLKDFCKFFANPNFKTCYNQLQRRLGRNRHPMLMPAFEDPSNQALLAKLQELGSINLAERIVKLYAKAARAKLGWSGEEAQLFIRMACGYGINAHSSELKAATLDKGHVADLIEEANTHRRLLGMKKEGSLQDTLPLPCLMRHAVHVCRWLERWQQPHTPPVPGQPKRGKRRGVGPRTLTCPPPFTLTPMARVGVHFIKVDSRVLHGVCRQLGLTKETRAAFTSEPALSHHWARWFNTNKLRNKEFHFERLVDTDGVSVCVHYTRPLPPPPTPPPAASSSSTSSRPSAAAAAAHAVGLPHIGIAEMREFVFDTDTQIGVGIDPGVTQAVSAASGVWDPATGQLKADQLRRWKLTKGEVKHASGLNNAHRDTERWLAPIKPHLQHLAAASSAGTSLEANLKHITVTLATWDAVWEVYLDPKWARQRLRLYGAQDRALEQFFKKLEKEMAELSMKRHNRAKQLVVFFGAASIGTRGGWGADAVLRTCRKVVCRPRGKDQDGGRVVLVDEHRTSRVSSAVNGKQPCEVELNTLSATRPAGWKPPAGQVEQRLLRLAWSQERGQPVRGLVWCPVVAPRRPPQAPRSSQEATQPAASEPGPSTPQPAKGSKRTKAEPAAEPTKGKAQGKAVKGLQITQPLPFNRGNMRRKERIVTLPWSYTVPS